MTGSAQLPDGRRLHFVAAGAGDAPLLLLLHGIGSNSRSFRHQVDELSDEFRVVAWDAPGYGQSDDPPLEFTLERAADDAFGLLKRLGAVRAHVLGHSMGGVIAQLLYHRHPACVLSLVLSDTNPGTGALPAVQRAQRVAARISAITRLTPAQLALERAPQTVSPNAPSELVREIADVMADIRPGTYRAAAISMGETDLTDQLSQIHVPTLVLVGELDTTTPPPLCEAMARAIPSSSFHIIPNAGHASNQEQPAAFNAAVRAFLRRVPCGLYGSRDSAQEGANRRSEDN